MLTLSILWLMFNFLMIHFGFRYKVVLLIFYMESYLRFLRFIVVFLLIRQIFCIKMLIMVQNVFFTEPFIR